MTKNEILAGLAANTISIIDASAMLTALENPKQPGRLYCKVSEKGGMSIYGLQRMPVTLYAEQWQRLIDHVPTMIEFLKVNKDKLTLKADKPATLKEFLAEKAVAVPAETTATVTVAS